LDASETNEQRDHEKLKIEKEFKKSDQKLNLLVSKHDGDLTQVMQLFGKVSTQISTSRERIHAVKANLQDCKQLLRCRREELKKLWMDAVQNKYLLEMLDQVNDLQKISSQINGHLSKKHYLHATKTLVTALKISEGQLKGVEGLNDLRNDFSNKKQMLYTKLIEELNKHLYQTSTQELLNSFQRQNSTKTSAYTSPFQRTVLRKSAERIEANSKAKKALFDISQNGKVFNFC
jgi:exocyst complex component 4